ncbi:MAG: hypothetical protein JO061_11865 [Acidobacteriaceae bacterium]|nr:hypothetical protein [Acidobacteriaceae bacterium]
MLRNLASGFLLLASTLVAAHGAQIHLGNALSFRMPDGWQDISRKRGASPGQIFLLFAPPGEEDVKGPIVPPDGALVVVNYFGDQSPDGAIEGLIHQHRGIEYNQTICKFPANAHLSQIHRIEWHEPESATFVYENIEEYFSIEKHVVCVSITYRLGNPRSPRFLRGLQDVLVSMKAH